MKFLFGLNIKKNNGTHFLIITLNIAIYILFYLYSVVVKNRICDIIDKTDTQRDLLYTVLFMETNRDFSKVSLFCFLILFLINFFYFFKINFKFKWIVFTILSVVLFVIFGAWFKFFLCLYDSSNGYLNCCE